MLAQDAAQQRGHAYIGTEHLLLGLLRQDRAVALAVLKARGIELADTEGAIAAVLQTGPQVGLKEMVPTSRVKRVIEMAFEEARADNSPVVDTGHLLLAVVREGEGIAAQVLRDRGGLTVETVGAEISRVRATGLREASGAQGPPNLKIRHVSVPDEQGRSVAITILFPTDYSEDQCDKIAHRVQAAVRPV